jgi:hypothetical protein
MRSIPFGLLLKLLVQGCQGLFLYILESLRLLPGILKDQEAAEAEEIDGVGGRGSGNITTVYVKMLLAWGLFSLTVIVSVPALRLKEFYPVFILVNIKMVVFFFERLPIPLFI